MSEDNKDTKEPRVPVNISDQLINDLNALSQAEATMTKIGERDFSKRKMPIKYNTWTCQFEWKEEDIRKFFEDPENVSRTIFCNEINVDMLDDYGAFGYTPGFIFIEEKRYNGNQTLTDRMASAGLSIAVDPKTGLGIMQHFDYFPRNKLEYETVRRRHDPKLFALMADIFTKRRIESGGDNSIPRLGTGT
jgi:hypothetical protein